jgi:hypothetical protein
MTGLALALRRSATEAHMTVRYFHVLTLLGCLLPVPAFAQRNREATPNIGNLFPRRLPEDSPQLVAGALRRYRTTERRLLADHTLDAADLTIHWRKLGKLRQRLERLEARGLLDGPNAELRAEVTRLLDHPIEVYVAGLDEVDVKLRDAAEFRLRQLLGLASLANRCFGMHIRSVLGVALEGGES